MLVIRVEQMDALRRSALKSVRAKLIAILRRKLPIQTARLSDDILHSLCDKGILAASRYGIGTECNVYVFIATMLLLGQDFDTNQKTGWSKEILGDEKMHENLKAKLLELRVVIDTGTDISPHG